MLLQYPMVSYAHFVDVNQLVLVGRPTFSRCYFLRILEINDDASSNQLFIGRFCYRLISTVKTKGDQSQNVSEPNGKPILVSETFCLALNYQPKNANK